jgi:hypothetical protein
MKKLSKAQQQVLDDLNNTINVLRNYKNFEDFYDNSPFGEQDTFTCGASCNSRFRTSELAKINGGVEKWEKDRKDFENCKNNGILIVFAKTETIKALEKKGAIKIIKEAEFKGSCEIVQVLEGGKE